MTLLDLKNIIIGSKDYEEEFVKAYLYIISEERIKKFEEERVTRHYEFEQQQIARQHAIEQQREQREFELEQLRLESELDKLRLETGSIR
ncbi:hypothetical protein TNIN_279481 [Trichonephila inaurata madagascariensis]|uniref:Uncharacterized protein n=1 Tax=Trichonephila inaurata madagascariensis TaxID=2747483 RepID=A0A8X7BT83_9ARAC|nr:hypothetical protein TNIN_279481 [Trichonephila inaurata madagascariensis]